MDLVLSRKDSTGDYSTAIQMQTKRGITQAWWGSLWVLSEISLSFSPGSRWPLPPLWGIPPSSRWTWPRGKKISSIRVRSTWLEGTGGSAGYAGVPLGHRGQMRALTQGLALCWPSSTTCHVHGPEHMKSMLWASVSSSARWRYSWNCHIKQLWELQEMPQSHTGPRTAPWSPVRLGA